MRPQLMPLLVALPLLGGLARAEPLPPEPDWAAVGAETAALLADYLRVDTTNPPGGELAGARFLADVLAAEGIVSEIDEFAPGRANLIARLPAARASGAGAVCLLSHIDVVTAEAARWTHPPLSGHIDADGIVWGRGALDMKGMGAVELEAMRLLKRGAIALDRDVVLLAVADEEMDNRGVLRAMERWDTIGCAHVVNEGGVGIRDMFFDGQVVFPISVGEKGYVWGEIVAEGEPGHGSTPLPDRAPERLVRAWQAVAEHDPAPVWDPALYALLHAVGEQKGGVAGAILKRPALVRLLLRRKLMANPLTRAVLTDTVYVTGFSGAQAHNVVPAAVRANVDARILPGTPPDAHTAHIRALLEDVPGVRFEVRSSTPGGSSPVDDPFYAALAASIQREGADIAVGPAISPGFTDSIHLRQLGVRAYGVVPFILTEEELRTMHGDNERVSTENLARGARVLYRALIALAAPQ